MELVQQHTTILLHMAVLVSEGEDEISSLASFGTGWRKVPRLHVLRLYAVEFQLLYCVHLQSGTNGLFQDSSEGCSQTRGRSCRRNPSPTG